MDRIIRARDLTPGDRVATAPGRYRAVVGVVVSESRVSLTLEGLALATIKGADSPVAVRAADTVAEHAALLLADRVTEARP